LRRLKFVWAGNARARYFLTLCTERRARILANDLIHERLTGFLLESPQRYQWWPRRYVLMPDHLHLLVAQGEPTVTLGHWVKAMKAMVGRRTVRWQAGYFDHVLRSRESEADKWEYIYLNPVRAGLASRPEEWPFAGEIVYEEAGPGVSHRRPPM
jgi:REP element-mobilizing transposase RayT